MRPRSAPGEFFLALGFLFLAFVAALAAFVWLGHLLRFPLTIAQPLAALGIVVLFGIFVAKRISAVAIFLAVLAVALRISTSVFDVTCDGQGYHGTGIMQLLEGWNPITEPQRADAPQALQREVMIHYAKGPWLIAAALCRLTGNIEAGKATTILLMVACFGLALHGLLAFTSLSRWKAVMLATLVAVNPISLSQCLTHYLDGQLAALFTCMVMGSCLLLLEWRAVYGAIVVIAIVLLINVKLTALVYVVTFGIVFALAMYAWKRFDALPKLAALYATGLLLGLTLGYDPYLTNFQSTGNPFFPFTTGSVKQGTEDNFLVHQMPVSFRGRNRLDAFLHSVFGRCQNDYDLASLTYRGGSLKVPFTISRDEITTFRNVDTRICGWGPLTSGILLIAVVALCLKKPRRVALVLTLCILATIFIMPHPWYARYVPQLWLLPVMAAIVLWLSKHKAAQIAGAALIVLMLANLLMVSMPAFDESRHISRQLRKQLKQFAQRDRVYQVCFGDFLVNRLRFRQAGIRYTELPTFPEPGKQLVIAGDSLLTSRTVVLKE